MTENNLNEYNASAVPCDGLPEDLPLSTTITFTRNTKFEISFHTILPYGLRYPFTAQGCTPRPVNAPCVVRLLSNCAGPPNSAQLQTKLLNS